MNIFRKIAAGLKKTKDSMMGKLEALMNSFTKIDEEFFEELEELLITCDIGVETSLDICGELRKKVKEKGITDPALIKDELKEIIAEMLGEDKKIDTSTTPTVILIIGVNGAGKTTTIGKLAARYKNEGKKVLVAAADTFRAAAIEQLEVWTERAGVDIVKHAEGSDPASVVFDAVTAAKARGTDILICDTAGRLHNKKNLMDELRKISRIVHQQAEGCVLETLLVLDSTTGQNAVNQAKLFSEVAEITGIVLTKLDGTAKGGIIISIHRELGIPVKLVGVGEKLDDLQDFCARDFADALFETETDFDYNYERLDDKKDEKEDEKENESVLEKAEDFFENMGNKIEDAADKVEDKFEEIGDKIEDKFEDIVDDIKDKLDGDDESEEGKEETADEAEKPAEKKDLKNGKFGFLFKEISFGKKKKADENEGEE
ncbi:MAG: signal recognition particle-docking protein FtsY [Oscillospiraceae bacterium]|nr:signal recognition particle-docking protein FtsY [Oscillospiraceae bacterium]